MKLYGNVPARSMRGVVFERAGQVLGCAGLFIDGEHMVLFFDGDHAEMRKAPLTAIKAAKALLEQACRRGVPIVSDASPEHEGSERLLKYLGFRHLRRTVFVFDSHLTAKGG